MTCWWNRAGQARTSWEDRRAQSSTELRRSLAADAASVRDFPVACRSASTPVVYEVRRPDQAVRCVSRGCAAVSVVTEKRWYHGSREDLAAVRAAVEVPVLRRDLVFCEYQLLEARAYGADAISLVHAALTSERLAELYGLALRLSMTPLVEVHDERGARLAAELGARAVYLDFTDPAAQARAAALLPPTTVTLAEAGAEVVLLGGSMIGDIVRREP
ncbi:hypothetical protein LWC34_47920 [Kibdelosporangium philippinense]|uniref:indole-3-glycerol-phosphate synthase n=1 Tax=Kibdelosporangium philippinense TaxID=211113 RepID=A0ABS8ZV44_9PSEU|nr:hypothetical protein [Kibdelosporangium philippinense]MCE7010481.1 hypothetical protein [Kibdelosporangium philippinense]